MASFKALDRDGDGKITKEELYNGFSKIYSHLKEEDLRKEVDRAFSRADLDGDGFIDFSEWQISCVNKEQIMKKERLIEAFKHFDSDGNGKISVKDIKKVFGTGGKKYGNENIWKQIIKEVDEDGDGYITFPEFQKMMNQFLRASEFIDRLTV
jgi:calcium-dependent protein kinase